MRPTPRSSSALSAYVTSVSCSSPMTVARQLCQSLVSSVFIVSSVSIRQLCQHTSVSSALSVSSAMYVSIDPCHLFSICQVLSTQYRMLTYADRDPLSVSVRCSLLSIRSFVRCVSLPVTSFVKALGYSCMRP